MPLFDIEYIFLKLREKSVGSKIELNVLCPDDEKTRVPVDVNLEDVNVLMSDGHTNEIKLAKKIKVVMKYPTLSHMAGFDTEGEVISIFEMVKNCIHEIHNDKSIINSIDVSSKELDDFIGQMSTENFEDIGAFFDTMPKLQHVIEVTNPKTKKKNEVKIEGIQNFF